VAVSIEMVPQMSKDQQMQAWQFWREVSRHLHEIITGTLGQPPGDLILIGNSKSDKSAGKEFSGEKLVESLKKEYALDVVSECKSLPVETITVQNQSGKSQLVDDFGAVLLTEPYSIGTSASGVGYAEKVTDSGAKEINIVIEASPVELHKSPPKRQKRQTNIKSCTDSGRPLRNKTAKDTSGNLSRPAKVKSKSDRKGIRGRKCVTSNPVEHEDGVLAAIHEANKTLKVGTVDVTVESASHASESSDNEEETEKVPKKNSGSHGRMSCEFCGKNFSNNSGLQGKLMDIINGRSHETKLLIISDQSFIFQKIPFLVTHHKFW
jgi:hypothetical protein